jgi:hypothetical protein
MLLPVREHLTPAWMGDLDETAQLRCATIVRKSETGWITDMTFDSPTRALDLAGRFQTMSQLPESFGNEAKRMKARQTEARLQRMRRNEARVLATAYEEDEVRCCY